MQRDKHVVSCYLLLRRQIVVVLVWVATLLAGRRLQRRPIGSWVGDAESAAERVIWALEKV